MYVYVNTCTCMRIRIIDVNTSLNKNVHRRYEYVCKYHRAKENISLALW